MTRKILLLIFIALSSLLLVSCGSSSSNDPVAGGATACANCKTFITSNNYTGDLITEEGSALTNGILAADALCMADANYPGTGIYKALIVDGTNRVACTTNNCTGSGTAENIDWVLHPSTNYYRSDGTTLVMTTNVDRIFVFGTLNNTFDTGVPSYWTGMIYVPGTSDWMTDTTKICSSWNNGTNAFDGTLGTAINTDISSIAGSFNSCDINRPLLCVEQ